MRYQNEEKREWEQANNTTITTIIRSSRSPKIKSKTSFIVLPNCILFPITTHFKMVLTIKERRS